MTRFWLTFGWPCELLCGYLSSCDVDQQWRSRDFSDEFSLSVPPDGSWWFLQVPDVLLGLLSWFWFLAKLSAKRFIVIRTNDADTLSTHVWILWEHIVASERRLTSRPLMADGNKVCVHSEFTRDTRALFSDMNTHMTSCFINLLTTNRSFGVFSLTHHLWSKLRNLV